MQRLRIRSRVLSPLTLVVGICSVTAISRSAAAQTSASDTARATELFKSGKVAFGRGDMAEAERLFAQAFEIRKSSDIAANLGQSQLEQEKFRAAAEHFSWALANLLPSASDAQRKAVETGLAKARSEVAALRLEVRPEGSDVLVGAQALGKAPLVGAVFVDPGEVIIAVKHDGYVAVDKRVIAAKGTEQAVQIELFPDERSAPSGTPVSSEGGIAAAGATKPATDAPPSSKSLVPAFVASGIAVAGGVTGLVLTLSANSKEDDADELLRKLGGSRACANVSSSECADVKDRRESVDASRNWAIGSFVVGGVSALVAGYFYWDALSSPGAGGAARAKASRALAPSLSLGRSRGSDSYAVESLELGVSGSF